MKRRNFLLSLAALLVAPKALLSLKPKAKSSPYLVDTNAWFVAELKAGENLKRGDIVGVVKDGKVWKVSANEHISTMLTVMGFENGNPIVRFNK